MDALLRVIDDGYSSSRVLEYFQLPKQQKVLVASLLQLVCYVGKTTILNLICSAEANLSIDSLQKSLSSIRGGPWK